MNSTTPSSRNSESNTSKDNCGICDNLVSWSEKGVACETCGKWFHAACQSIGSQSYQNLENSDVLWFCDICGNNNYSLTMFDLHGVEEETTNEFSFASGDEFKPFHASTPTRQNQQEKFRNRPLRIVNINFQSLCGKKAESIEMIDRLKPDIIIGTETWLKPEVSDSELFTPQYQVYRQDRRKGSHGGVIIAVKTNLHSTVVEDMDTNSDSGEILWVKVLTKTQKPIYFCAFYRSDVSDLTALSGLEASLRKSAKLKNAHLIVAGDFNIPQWDWHNMCFKPHPKYIDEHQSFIDSLYDLGLQQMVLEPTRENNILDLVLSNAPDLVTRIEVVPGLSDHSLVFFEYDVKVDKKKNVLRQIFLYNKANWDCMKSDLVELNENFDRLENYEVDELWLKFKNCLHESMNKHIPKKTTRPRDSYPWITPDMRKIMRKRDKLSCKGKKLGNQEMIDKSKEYRKEAKKQVRQGYWKYVGNLIEEKDEKDQTRPSLKRLFTFIKHQQKSSIGVSPLKSGGRLVTDPKNKAEILNAQFYKSFSSGEEYSEEEFKTKCSMTHDKNYYKPMPDIDITQNGIEKLLINLVPTKAAGPDGISPRVLKELAHEIAPLLTKIFRASLDTGVVPQDWRHALVTPVFKKGERYDAINYRPVSLTCIPCKVMEHVVVSNIMRHLEEQDILCSQQHGFRSGHSCETQLLEFIEEAISSLDEGKETDVIIMDFAKAFDRVNHSLLVHKLEFFGIQGTANRWIESFLKNRTQAVVVEGETSSAISVRSGVPQGSVLGPCLFLLYINDLPDRVSSVSRLFADDTLLHRLIASIKDRQTLQQDLKELEKWEEEWDMSFHPNKCNVLPVSRKLDKKKKQDQNTETFSYDLHGHTLESVDCAKYLGVTIEKNITWSKHIDNIHAKANRLLGFLRRNLRVATTKNKGIGL